MTASFPNRNVVIASVQTGGDITPAHIVSSDVPQYRDNGGDLLVGDTHYNPTLEVIYFYDGSDWIPMGGPGVFGPMSDRVAELETEVTNIEGRVTQLETLVQALPADVDAVEDELETLEDRVSVLESDTPLVTRILSLENIVTPLGTRLTNLETHVTELIQIEPG